MKIKLTISVIFIVTCFLILPSNILAQNVSLSINPPLTEIMIKPGKSITHSVKIINSGDDALINVSWLEYDDKGLKTKDSESVNWLTILNPEVTVERAITLTKNGELDLVVKINPPANTEERDYYRALTVTSHPSPFEGFSQSKVSTTLASLFLISVSENGLEKKAIVTDFKLPLIHDSTSPLPLDIKVKNSGATFFRLNGKLSLTGFIGKADFRLIPQALLVNQEKRLSIEEKNNQISGFYLGKYKLAYNFVLDEGNIQVRGEKIFYALPWKATFIGITLLLTLKIIKKLKKPLRQAEKKK